MDKNKKSFVPIDSDAYKQVGTTVNQDSKISSNIVDQINNSGAEVDTGVAIIDPQNIFGTDSYTFESEQSNSRKSINNHSSVVEQYNRSGMNNIDDNYSVSSYEDQLNNSQDLVFYTQQPKAPMEMPPPMMPNNPSPYNPYTNANYNMMPNGLNPYNNYNMTPNGQFNPYNMPLNGYNNMPYYPNNNMGYPNTPPMMNQPMNNQYMNNEPPRNVRNDDDNSLHTKHRKTIGPKEFEKKMKRNLRPFNFMLAFIYILIIGVIVYFGYNFWLDQQDFYFSKSKINLALGSSYEETVFIKGKVDDNTNYTWESEDTSIANVDEKGNITSIKEGTTDIKVTNKKTKQTNTITVKVINVQVKQFTIDPSEKVVYLGNSYTIVPLVNGQSSLTIDLSWTNSNSEIATVDESGVVTPKKAGRTTITVSIPNTKFKDSITIIVVEKK